MLKNLRKRLAFQMFLISAILVALVTAVLLYANISFLASKTNHALEVALDSTVTINMKPVDSGYVPGRMGTGYNSYEGMIITVISDKKGNVLAYNCNRRGYKIDQVQLSAITKKVVENKKEEGYAAKGKDRKAFRYMKKEINNGEKIVYADRSEEIKSFRFFLIHYLIADVIVLIFVLIFVRYLSKRAVLPVEMALNEQKRFIADASHELKTPLSVIMANVDIMASNQEATIADNMRWINNTEIEAKRMNKLVHDMLLLAKTDTLTAAMEGNYKPLDFSKLVEGCAMTIEVLAFERSLTMNQDIETGIKVLGDEERLVRLVTILMENAMKYVNKNGVIDISLKSFSSYIQLTVTNTGHPIPEEKQNQVFRRFFRADESRSNTKDGYGLGLSIARNITENHGGIIELLYSNEKLGTCFSVKLPHLGDTKRKRNGSYR